jgi:hypothetical protein
MMVGSPLSPSKRPGGRLSASHAEENPSFKCSLCGQEREGAFCLNCNQFDTRWARWSLLSVRIILPVMLTLAAIYLASSLADRFQG